MKTNLLLVMAACAGSLFAANKAQAQETVVVAEEDVIVANTVDCKDRYYVDKKDNWFIQLGAGVAVPFVENSLVNGDADHHFTATYNLGFGKWFSPYLGWRMGFNYSTLHWDNQYYSKAKSANVNFDFMWDMCNSLGGVNASRPVSVIPFVGIGGTFNWDYKAPASNCVDNGHIRRNQWLLPVSAGIQVRFRLCSYVDFFLEGRAAFYGDNFNNCVYDKPIDVNITAIGGFSFNLGGAKYRTYNPCNDLAYINSLNNQVNTLRNDLALTTAALAAAQAQLPCPEVVVPDCPEAADAPMLTTVRFTINSAKISDEEMVNVYNVAKYLKENPDVNVIIKGYADKDTGTAAYNKELSQRRAQAVYDALTKNYGIDGKRLTTDAEGSATQPYDTNNWNRIVIFVPAN